MPRGCGLGKPLVCGRCAFFVLVFVLAALFLFFAWLWCGPVAVIVLASRLWGERAQFGLDGRFRVVLLWVGQVLLHY